MKLICFFLGHKWSKWIYLGVSGRYDERLKKVCQRCGNQNFYTGTTDYNKNGEKVPYNEI